MAVGIGAHRFTREPWRAVASIPLHQGPPSRGLRWRRPFRGGLRRQFSLNYLALLDSTGTMAANRLREILKFTQSGKDRRPSSKSEGLPLPSMPAHRPPRGGAGADHLRRGLEITVTFMKTAARAPASFILGAVSKQFFAKICFAHSLPKRDQKPKQKGRHHRWRRYRGDAP